MSDLFCHEQYEDVCIEPFIVADGVSFVSGAQVCPQPTVCVSPCLLLLESVILCLRGVAFVIVVTALPERFWTSAVLSRLSIALVVVCFPCSLCAISIGVCHTNCCV